MLRKYQYLIQILLPTIMFILAGCSGREEVSLSKVEHIYVRSEQAKEQFEFFTEGLQLPIVWDYEDWGNFTSGGVSLGNLVLELVDANHSEKELPFGMALKPETRLERLILKLDEMSVSHDNIQENKNWSLLALHQVLPNHIDLFVCDYQDWKQVERDRNNATERLKASQGGALGIQTVEVIAVQGPMTVDIMGFERLPGITKADPFYKFEKGPKLLLETSERFSMGLTLMVNSLQKAKGKLDELEIQNEIIGERLTINDNQFELKIDLVEN